MSIDIRISNGSKYSQLLIYRIDTNKLGNSITRAYFIESINIPRVQVRSMRARIIDMTEMGNDMPKAFFATFAASGGSGESFMKGMSLLSHFLHCWLDGRIAPTRSCPEGTSVEVNSPLSWMCMSFGNVPQSEDTPHWSPSEVHCGDPHLAKLDQRQPIWLAEVRLKLSAGQNWGAVNEVKMVAELPRVLGRTFSVGNWFQINGSSDP